MGNSDTNKSGTWPPTVAVLGVGQMGRPMASRIVSAGFTVRVWDRSPAKAAPLVDAGATAASSPAEAAVASGILLTMLSDGPAVYAVMGDAEGLLAVAEPGVVWLQMSTVGIEWTDRLAALAGAHGVTFVDAPVSGSVAPAEAGTLLVLAGGPGRSPRDRETRAGHARPADDLAGTCRCRHQGEAGAQQLAGRSRRVHSGDAPVRRRSRPRPRADHRAPRRADRLALRPRQGPSHARGRLHAELRPQTCRQGRRPGIGCRRVRRRRAGVDPEPARVVASGADQRTRRRGPVGRLRQRGAVSP